MEKYLEISFDEAIELEDGTEVYVDDFRFGWKDEKVKHIKKCSKLRDSRNNKGYNLEYKHSYNGVKLFLKKCNKLEIDTYLTQDDINKILEIAKPKTIELTKEQKIELLDAFSEGLGNTK